MVHGVEDLRTGAATEHTLRWFRELAQERIKKAGIVVLYRRPRCWRHAETHSCRNRMPNFSNSERVPTEDEAIASRANKDSRDRDYAIEAGR
jgi:hypothetical protein